MVQLKAVESRHFRVPCEFLLCCCVHLSAVHASHCKFRATCQGSSRALLYNFWLPYVKTLIVLMKQMEGMREYRDGIACDENQQCSNTA